MMAFTNKNLSVVAMAHPWTIWYYTSRNETVNEISNDIHYFVPVKTLLNTGDVIIITGKDGTGIRYAELTDNAVWLYSLK